MRQVYRDMMDLDVSKFMVGSRVRVDCSSIPVHGNTGIVTAAMWSPMYEDFVYTVLDGTVYVFRSYYGENLKEEKTG